MTTLPGPPPQVTEESRPFWEAGARNELVVERCRACGAHVFPLRGVCRFCLRRDMEPVVIPGPGTVYSFSVNHQPWLAGMEVPYVLALVEFPEGVRVLGRLSGCPIDAVAIGMEVDVAFVPGPGGSFVPGFVARREGGT